MIYIVILLLLIMGSYRFDYCRRTKYRTFTLIITWVVLVCLAGLRYRIGFDTVTYEYYYKGWPKIWEIFNYHYDWSRFEPGYLIFASIPRSISDDFIALQLFESVIVNSVMMWFIIKNTRHVFMALAMYFLILYFVLNCEVMREAMAVSLFLLAWPSLQKGRWWLYYLLAIVATTIHVSSTFMLFVPVFFLPGIRKMFYYGRHVYVILAILLAFGIMLQANFHNFFMLLAMNDRMTDRVNAYSSLDLSGNILNAVGMVTYFIRMLLYPLIALYFLHKQQRHMSASERKAARKWEIMTVMGIYVIIMSIPVFILNRFFNYFGIFLICTVASWVYTPLKMPRRTYRLRPMVWGLVLTPLFFLQFYNYFSDMNKSGTLKHYMIFYPYSTRIDSQTDPNREALIRYMN